MKNEENLSFEDRLDFIQRQIEKRKSKWTLSTYSWEDASQEILIRVWKKYHTYKPEVGKFENWVNRLISNAIHNLLRDNLYKYARPCISAGSSGGACIKNTGGDGCSYTPSRTQCSECPLYADWEKKKKNQYNVKDTVSIENHTQEVYTRKHEDIDVDMVKTILDEEMPKRLNSFEWKVYQMLHIQNLSEEEVGKKLKYKKSKNSKTPGYQMIRTLKKRFVVVSREIIDERGLTDTIWQKI